MQRKREKRGEEHGDVARTQAKESALCPESTGEPWKVYEQGSRKVTPAADSKIESMETRSGW